MKSMTTQTYPWSPKETEELILKNASKHKAALMFQLEWTYNWKHLKWFGELSEKFPRMKLFMILSKFACMYQILYYTCVMNLLVDLPKNYKSKFYLLIQKWNFFFQNFSKIKLAY